MRCVLTLFFVLGCSVGHADHYSKDFFSLPSLQYPVYSNEMVAAVGMVDINLEYPVFQSVAIVGADEISAHWLRLNNKYLISISAIGVVVHVESAEQLAALQLYTDIPLIAVPGFSAPMFGNVYPIVVDASAGRVRQ